MLWCPRTTKFLRRKGVQYDEQEIVWENAGEKPTERGDIIRSISFLTPNRQQEIFRRFVYFLCFWKASREATDREHAGVTPTERSLQDGGLRVEKIGGPCRDG